MAGAATSARPSAMYARLASLYDAIYAEKPYAAEARRLVAVARRYGRRRPRDWLDVACGTGRHLAELRDRFHVVGVDASDRMLRIARRRLPGVRLVRADLRTFDLGARFDVVSCLFSAIGYLRTGADLTAAFRNFARHLRPGGVALIEPWLAPDELRGPKHIGMNVYRDDRLRVVRMGVLRRRGSRSYLDLEYLVGIEGRGIERFRETEVLRLTPRPELFERLRAAGLAPRGVGPGPRALIVARAPGGR